MRSHLLLTSLSEELDSSFAPLSSLDLMKSLALLDVVCLLLALPMGVSALLGVFFPLSYVGLLTIAGPSAEVLAPTIAACLSFTCISRRDLVEAKSSISF